MKEIEFVRRIPVVSEVDVAVIGAGPAGIPAAIASARSGAKTILIERFGWLGGQVNQEMPFIGFLDSQGNQIIKGIGDEIIQKLVKLHSSPGHIPDEHEASFTPIDSRMFNYVSLQMLREAGVEILLDSFFVDAIIRDELIDVVIIANKSGHQAIRPKFVVDCTGDADVAARAGVPFKKGREKDGKMMGILLWLTFYGVNWEEFRDALSMNPELYDVDTDTPGISGLGMKPEYFQKVRYINFWGFRKLVEKARQEGYEPGNTRVGVFCPGKMDQGVYATLRYDDIDGTSGAEVSKADAELRMMIPKAVAFVNKWLPGWERAVLISSSPILGVQDTRVIEGLYALTEDDILAGKRFSDVIAVGGAKIDDWDTYKMIYPKGNYDVPLRCLIPTKVENLFVAGRCISATRKAMMSVRCMSMCTATGQAAGLAASLCAREGNTNRSIEVSLLQKELLAQGANLGSIA